MEVPRQGDTSAFALMMQQSSGGPLTTVTGAEQVSKARRVGPPEIKEKRKKIVLSQSMTTTEWDGASVIAFVPSTKEAQPLGTRKPYKVNLQLNLRDRVDNLASMAGIPITTQPVGIIADPEFQEEIEDTMFGANVTYQCRKGALSLDESVIARAARQKVGSAEGYTGGLFSWYALEQKGPEMRLFKVKDVLALKPFPKVVASRGDLSAAARKKLLGFGRGGEAEGSAGVNLIGDFFNTEEDQMYGNIADDEAPMETDLGRAGTGGAGEEDVDDAEGDFDGFDGSDGSASNSDDDDNVGTKRSRKNGDGGERPLKKQKTEGAASSGFAPPNVIPPKAPEDLQNKCEQFVIAHLGKPPMAKDAVIKAILRTVSEFESWQTQTNRDLKKEWYRVASSSILQRVLPSLGCEFTATEIIWPQE